MREVLYKRFLPSLRSLYTLSLSLNYNFLWFNFVNWIWSLGWVTFPKHHFVSVPSCQKCYQKYENILKRSLPSDDLFFLSCAIISFLLKSKRRNVYVDLSFQNACFSQILISGATLTDYYRELIKFCVFFDVCFSVVMAR